MLSLTIAPSFDSRLVLSFLSSTEASLDVSISDLSHLYMVYVSLTAQLEQMCTCQLTNTCINSLWSRTKSMLWTSFTCLVKFHCWFRGILLSFFHCFFRNETPDFISRTYQRWRSVTPAGLWSPTRLSINHWNIRCTLLYRLLKWNAWKPVSATEYKTFYLTIQTTELISHNNFFSQSYEK